MRRGAVFTVGALLVLATIGAWIYTLVKPTQFGVCHIVPLYFGHQPSVRDCQPIEVAFFAVPIGAIALVVPFMLYLAGDAEISIPFFGTTLLLRQAQLVSPLFDVADLDTRTDAWLDTLDEEPPA